VKRFKRKILHYIQLNILPYLLQLFVRFIYLTSKKQYHHGTLTTQEKNNQNFIFSMWHGDLLMQPFNYHKFKPNHQLKVIISDHRDGETIRSLVRYLGIDSLSGSSTRGGAKALIGAIKTLKSGVDVAITPDGPKGPIYSIADGLIVIAQKTDTKIVCASSIPSSYWKFKSWDKFILPKPFGKIDFYMSEPFSVTGLTNDEAKKLIYEKMMENQLDK